MKFLHWFGIPVVMATFMTTSAMALLNGLNPNISGSGDCCFRDLAGRASGWGNDYHDPTAHSCDETLLQVGQWQTVFPYGNVYGYSRCSSIGGTQFDVADDTTGGTLQSQGAHIDGGNCWCRIDSIDGYNAVSKWVLRSPGEYSEALSCQVNCSSNCAAWTRDEARFRSAMFETIPLACHSVDFDDTTNGGISPDPQNPTIYRKYLYFGTWFRDSNCENAYSDAEIRSLLQAPESEISEQKFVGYFSKPENGLGEEVFHNNSSYVAPVQTDWYAGGSATLFAQYECDRSQGLVFDETTGKCVFGGYSVEFYCDRNGEIQTIATLGTDETLGFQDVVEYADDYCKQPCGADEIGFNIEVYYTLKEMFVGPTTNSPMTSGVITGGDSYVVDGITYTSPYQILLRPNCDPKINIKYVCTPSDAGGSSGDDGMHRGVDEPRATTNYGDGVSGIQGTPGASYTTLAEADSGCHWDNHYVKFWTYSTGDANNPEDKVTPGSNITLPRNMAELTLTAVWAGANIICEPGYFLPAGGSRCKICTDDHYCPGGEFPLEPEKDEGLNPCPEKLRSGAGQDEIGDCGRILHVENCINGECSGPYVYLRSNKKTMPSLNVEIEGKVYYGNMFMVGNGVDGLIKTEYNGSTYVVCDETDRDICTGIGQSMTFDPSIDGTEYSTDGEEWQVIFPYGTITGTGFGSGYRISEINDNYTHAGYVPDQSEQTTLTNLYNSGQRGEYVCYCRMDTPATSRWIVLDNYFYIESSYCPGMCAHAISVGSSYEVDGSVSFRSVIFDNLL